MSTVLNVGRRVADSVLEASIVGSFSSVGYNVRRRLFQWQSLPSMTGQTVIITGGSSGIGRSVAEGLLGLGADVYLTSRSRDRAEAVAAEMAPTSGQGRAVGLDLDIGSRESIDKFVSEVADLAGPIDVLINNAGALMNHRQVDDQGRELTLSTHLIGPFALSCLLRPHLRDGARLLVMSSGGMYSQPLRVDHLELGVDDYNGATAYAMAKRAQVELVRYLGPRWAPQTIVHAVHPGWVDTPGVDDALPGFARIMGPVLRTPDQGADTMIWLAATGGDGRPGSFWHDRSTRGTSYRPGTTATDQERLRLVRWLESATGVSAGLD